MNTPIVVSQFTNNFNQKPKKKEKKKRKYDN